MLALNMFDGIFDRRDLDNLLTLLEPATDVHAQLRPWGWKSTFTSTLHGLPVQISLLPPWTAGHLNLALTDEIRRDMRVCLDHLAAPRIWLHAEPMTITLQPSTND
ncbi:hypothetical protein [Catellatospora citrea]|uniref:Uncharacterized protein n=1 Tax=Catellatospora citrea TaxID=53366 RepID=A0A8J3P392_9ACTN|nr:hypothetical protein [Catellatospora citrea]RKE07917.1 hypothetical protein C8E86_2756 [Catellatospora citrea]GIG02072.1 hypothetical protein Cci01nite_71650 [Catellatospora citrea]